MQFITSLHFMHIISGTLKGRRLHVSSTQLNNEHLRPTTGYTKNVLFNILASNPIVQSEINGCNVLDGFCGIGAVGFEFLSRGASSVTFIDSEEHNIFQIHKNAEKLKINYNARVGFFPHAKIKEEFDFIFIDPPYIAAQSQILKTLNNLKTNSLKESGTLILELHNRKSNIEEKIADILDIVLKKEVSDKTVLLFLKKP